MTPTERDEALERLEHLVKIGALKAMSPGLAADLRIALDTIEELRDWLRRAESARVKHRTRAETAEARVQEGIAEWADKLDVWLERQGATLGEAIRSGAWQESREGEGE